MLSSAMGSAVGQVRVQVAVDGVVSLDDLVHHALEKIIFVGPDVPPAIRDQAVAYQARIESVLRDTLVQAQRSQSTAMGLVLERAGETRAAALVRGL